MFSESLRLTFGCRAEIDVHPHASQEKADLFHAVDGTSAELETLNYLNALVYLYKPTTVIETGTHRGFSAIAIGAALKINGFGKLHTLDWDGSVIDVALDNIQRYDADLMSYIDIHRTESRHWLSNYRGPAFDFAFLDSDVACRHWEYSIMEQRSLFAPGAIVMLHDTSSERYQYFDDLGREMLSAMDSLTEGKQTWEFSLCRGFRLYRVS